MTIDPSRLGISVEEQERWRRRMNVTIPADLVVAEERQAARSVASRMKMKGFRKGKVPTGMVAARFGGALRREALDRLMKDAYKEALAHEGLRPISEGEIEEFTYEPDSGDDLTFSIAFDVEPALDLERVGGFSVERPYAEVTDAHIDEMLQRLREQHGSWAPVEAGTPVDGDLVSVRIRRLDSDEDDEADAEGKEYEFELGEGDAIADVEDAIRTLEPGASGDFTVTFPEDFPAEDRRGLQERIEVTLQGRKSKALPELDDEFARQVGDFETVEALRSRIREDLEREAGDQAEGAVRGRLLDFVVEANPFEVPRSMVERYARSVIGDESKIPEERMESILEDLRPEAERAVKRILVIEKVADTQSLRATESDIDDRIEEIARKNDTDAAKVYASLQKSGRLEALEREITERRVFDFLKEQSEITEAQPA